LYKSIKCKTKTRTTWTLNKNKIDKLTCEGVELCPKDITPYGNTWLWLASHTLVLVIQKKSTRLWEGNRNLTRVQIGQHGGN
jgi:hypothetical protein